MQTEPEQWAVEAWERYGPMIFNCEITGPEALRLVAEDQTRKLREAVQSIERICRENVRETDAPDRVKWDGVWHEGPLATAYIQTLQAFGDAARQALKETPDAG